MSVNIGTLAFEILGKQPLKFERHLHLKGIISGTRQLFPLVGLYLVFHIHCFPCVISRRACHENKIKFKPSKT